MVMVMGLLMLKASMAMPSRLGVKRSLMKMHDLNID